MAEPRNRQNYSVPSTIPKAKAVTVNTASAEAIGQNDNRSRLVFFNPNTTANIFICPKYDTDGDDLDAVVNGAGSIWIVPGGSWIIEGDCYTAFNAISDTDGSALTIWES